MIVWDEIISGLPLCELVTCDAVPFVIIVLMEGIDILFLCLYKMFHFRITKMNISK